MALFKDGLRAQLFSERVRGGFAVRSGEMKRERFGERQAARLFEIVRHR